MAFCVKADVAKLLENIKLKGWIDGDIDSRIIRADEYLKSILISMYGASTVTGWTNKTVPKTIGDVSEMLTAYYIKLDFINDYKMSESEKKFIFEYLEDLKNGKVELLDRSNNRLSRSHSKVRISTYGKTPVFTSHHPDEDDYGDGSLDDFGVASTSSDE